MIRRWLENIKAKYKAAGSYFMYVITLSGVIFFVAFTSASHATLRCRSINIYITDKEQWKFVTQDEIMDVITNGKTEMITGAEVADIHLKTIEKNLLQNSFISSAEAYINLKGDLLVNIRQRIPVIRVYNARNENYYLDNFGKVMPLSPNYTARVVVASSAYEADERDTTINQLNAKLFALAQSINKDSFLFALTGQISIDSAQEFSIIPRMGETEILLGDTSVLENKFHRLKLFYKAVYPADGWDKYQSISLKYKHQVIAKRKNDKYGENQ